MLRSTDYIIIRSIYKNKYRVFAPNKWWINRNTPVGEDAELYLRKPYGGKEYISWDKVIGHGAKEQMEYLLAVIDYDEYYMSISPIVSADFKQWKEIAFQDWLETEKYLLAQHKN